MTYNKAQILAQIIIRVKLGAASEEEREVLGAWLDECEENRQLYKNIIRWKCIGERLRLEDEINQTTDFKRVHRVVSRRLAYKNSGQKRWVRVAWTSGVAAVCLYGMFFIWNLMRQPDMPLVSSEQRKVRETEISPKQGKVMLVLEDGRQIGLERDASDSIKLAQITIVETGKSLQYRPIVDSISPSQEVIHKIYTTIGGDYLLVLSDGTRVWLNAETELEYPAQFVGKERKVKLTGEAYFEVMPDAERPFVVETGNMQTRVLGTSFNIKAYTNEGAIYTTLLSGKVEVSLADCMVDVAPVVLEPGMQSYWKRGASDFELREVDLDNVIAWRYGVFVFNEDCLDVVTRVLSRWYGVRFVEDGGGIGRHTFSGKISKDEKLESILKILTLAGGPEFKREGDIVHVMERK